MHAAAIALAALLTALPFPPPKGLQVTDKTRCDWGPIASIAPGAAELVLTTPAGAVTYKTGPEVQVYSAEGKPLGTVSVLKPGQTVRVYYVIDNGAKAQEIDVT